MPALNILVVDDEPAGREVLAAAVRKAGYSVDVAADLSEATSKLSHGDIDVALCDIRLGDGNGIDLLRYSRASGFDTAFIMVTAFASLETAVDALRAGATDYIVRPVRHPELLHQLAQIEALNSLREENKALRKAVRESLPICTLASCAMQRIERLVNKIAPTDSTVLITGESGTGKGVVARMIHERSGRHDAAFLTVNCGAIPEQLMESEFFGYTKGAFTGADRARKGLFIEADLGTLFLDEIGELPLQMQTKLLNAIEDKEIRPLGGWQARKTNTRIIAATNRSIPELIRQGTFREDLYFRLKVFEIAMPPLRERRDDLRALIEFFVRGNRFMNTTRKLGLDPDAEEMLLDYSWPGNVRELQNVVQRACLVAEGDAILVDDLPSDLVDEVLRQRPAKAPAAADQSLRSQRRKIETEIILDAVYKAGGDRKVAAQQLGISLTTLYNRINDLERK